MIETCEVKDRRKLRFESFGDVLHDAGGLAEAERRGTLRVAGNWTLGQALGHLGFWMRGPLDGYPPMRRPPWWMRLMMPLMKRYILNKGMPAGVRIPDTAEGTFGVERLETGSALAELREAYARLTPQAAILPSPFLGRLSYEELVKLNLRHAELHLSFFHPS